MYILNTLHYYLVKSLRETKCIKKVVYWFNDHLFNIHLLEKIFELFAKVYDWSK